MSMTGKTGDRYLLKLFRDFVLHQVREDGSPMLDWGHVVECLNKLDAGVPEKVSVLRLCRFHAVQVMQVHAGP